jgi:hypothetical protein
VRELLALGVAVSTAALAGCGGVRAADLMLIERSGPGSGARLTLLINEEGGVRCDGGAQQRRLSDAQLVQARAITEELHGAASSRLSLPAQPRSVYGYRVRDADGSVSFADNSAHQPSVLHELALFVLNVAQQVCRLRQ